MTIVKALEERYDQVSADVIGSTEWWARRMPVQLGKMRLEEIGVPVTGSSLGGMGAV
ncbi:MAG: hypothetical protein ACR2O5_00745 [Thiogranum sp.]